MTTIETIKNFLDLNTEFDSSIAGTGSLYIQAQDLKIRVSDHEEAVTRLRESADKCFYTRNIENRTFSAGDILFELLDWLSYEIDFDFNNDLKIKIYAIDK